MPSKKAEKKEEKPKMKLKFLYIQPVKATAVYNPVNHPEFTVKKEAVAWFKKMKKAKHLAPGEYAFVDILDTAKV